MKCLTDEQIAVYLDHRRADPEYNSITEHLNSCDRCLSRMTQVYDLLNYPGRLPGKVRKPGMPEVPVQKRAEIFRLRFVVPAASAAAALLIAVLFNFTSPVKVNDSKIIGDNTKGHSDGVKVQKRERSMFSLKLDAAGSGKLKRDASSFSVKTGPSTAISFQGYSDSSEGKTPGIDERLALERKMMLMRCGFYYFMIKQGGASSMLASWNDLLDMCFPGLELKSVSAAATERFEDEISAREGDDRENFIRGFVLSYYIYAEGNTYGDAEIAALVEKYLKNERLLGISGMVNSTFEGRKASADKIRGYFVR